MHYKICPIIRNNTEPKAVNKFNDDGSVSSIPFNPDNTDYQAYLKWVSEGNVAQPADEV